MKSKILYFTVAVLIAPPAFAWGADIFGSWMAHEPGMREYHLEHLWLLGETVFSFRVDGSKLTGTISDPNGERTAITEGRINGAEISFIAARSLSGREVKLLYKGEVFENEIRFTRKVLDGTSQPQEFVARREFQRDGDIPLIRRKMPEPEPINEQEFLEKHHAIIIRKLEEKMAELESLGFPDPGEKSGMNEERIPPIRWEQIVSATEFLDLRKVQVRVLWNEGVQERVLELTAYFSRK